MGLYVNGQAYTPMGGVSPAKIAEATEQWLEENISQETGYVVDKTLAIDGAAADAKVTGDTIATQLLRTFQTGTADGTVASFSDGGDDLPIKSLSINIPITQAGSGYPAPDNMRPITGWTGLTIYHSGGDSSNPDAYTASFPGTIYGGVLNITVDGSATLTVHYIGYDMGDLEWGLNDYYGKKLFYHTFNEKAIATTGDNQVDHIFSSIYQTKGTTPTGGIRSNGKEYMIYPESQTRRLFIVDSNYSTAEDFKAAVAGQTIVIPLETPLIYELDPIQLRSFRGVNKVWANTGGDIQLEYFADPNLSTGITKDVTDETLWSVLGIDSATGVYATDTTRLSTRRIIYPEYTNVTTLSGYSFAVFAWDESDTYLGSWSQNAFSIEAEANDELTFFDFSLFPDYSFVLELKNVLNPNADIALDECRNCAFTRDYSKKLTEAIDLLSDHTEEVINQHVLANEMINIPVDIKRGDTIIAKCMMDEAQTNSQKLVASLFFGGAQKDYLFTKTIAQKGLSCAKTVDFDVDEIRLYAQVNATFEIRHISYCNTETVCEKATKANRRSWENASLLDIVCDSNAMQAIGEQAINVNREYIPEEKMKMFFLDNNYKYFSVANLEAIIDQMALSGLNYLVLGFGGSGRGLGFKLNDMTVNVFGQQYDLTNSISTNNGRYLTEADMESIISYAEGKSVGIIPCFNAPGHFARFLVETTKFRYKTTDFSYEDRRASANINDPEAREFAYKCAELYMAWFAQHGCKYWHMGGDEFSTSYFEYSNLFLSGNYNYALFINQMAFIAAKYRMIPMSWNDPYCIDRSIYPYINRKVLVCYWAKGTAAHNRGYAADIRKNGNPLINASEDIYYVVNATPEKKVTVERIRQFDVKRFKGSTNTPLPDPLGACFCAWIGNAESLDDDGAAITTELLPLIAAFGETIAPQLAT